MLQECLVAPAVIRVISNRACIPAAGENAISREVTAARSNRRDFGGASAISRQQVG